MFIGRGGCRTQYTPLLNASALSPPPFHDRSYGEEAEGYDQDTEFSYLRYHAYDSELAVSRKGSGYLGEQCRLDVTQWASLVPYRYCDRDRRFDPAEVLRHVLPEEKNSGVWSIQKM